MIEALSKYRYPLDEMALCSLRICLDEIAARFTLPIYEWEEDGLGPARSAGCRLPSGLVVVLQEHGHAVKHLGLPAGPTIYVDVGEIATRGVDSLVDEILGALALRRTDLDWIQPPEAGEWAGEHAERARQYHAARQQRGQAPPTSEA